MFCADPNIDACDSKLVQQVKQILITKKHYPALYCIFGDRVQEFNNASVNFPGGQLLEDLEQKAQLLITWDGWAQDFKG